MWLLNERDCPFEFIVLNGPTLPPNVSPIAELDFPNETKYPGEKGFVPLKTK